MLSFKKKHFSYIGITSLMILSLGLILSFDFSTTSNYTVSKYRKSNIMCAPITRVSSDPICAVEPMAPSIDVKWNNQMNITASDEAKEFFNQGLFYLYGFNHAEAERSFKEGIRLDPNCAMCYWGASLSLGPNINIPMPENQIVDAYKYSQKALKLSAKVSPKEQALIRALTHRYLENPPEDRTPLDLDYANEMKYVASRYREDLDIATLYAEALMDLMPWDYWNKDNTPKPETREVRTLLDYVLEKDPNHPGANHYYIHLTEAVHPQLGVPSADRLSALDYPAGHLIHMPSHVYIRVGRFRDAYDVNVRAIAEDEEYIATCNVQGLYPALYYPHNVHFLWFVAMMEGRSQEAISTAKKLEEKVPYAMIEMAPLIELFKPIYILTLARFGKWDEILNTPKPDNRFKYSNNMWHYAWGMAYAKKGHIGKAAEQLELLKKGLQNEELRAVDDPQFPTILSSEIAIQILKAEIAGQKGDVNKKVTHLEKAVALQDQLIYMEPPLFYYQIRLSLGDALLEAGEMERAEEIFREDLAEFPANGWALKGLQLSLKGQKRNADAAHIERGFKNAWSSADIQLQRAVF